MNEAGETLSAVKIDNDPIALASAISTAGERPEVVIEATVGWYWAADVLEEAGALVHLANPSGLNWGRRRVKNDERDATDLADMLRMGRLPEAWLAPSKQRELRELVRYRARLVELRAGLKSQIHAVLAKQGMAATRRDLFGAHGSGHFDELALTGVYADKVNSLRTLIANFDEQITWAGDEIAPWLEGDLGYVAIQQIVGIGPVLAAVFVAEIGDVTRFSSPEALSSWAGLTPRHRESDTKVTRGRITKQGSALVRWAAVEAISRHRDPVITALYARVAERRGNNIARVAAARKLLGLVYYGLRDGEIRCLARAG